MGFIIGLAVGLVLGWNLIPQPAFVAALYTKYFGHAAIVADVESAVESAVETKSTPAS